MHTRHELQNIISGLGNNTGKNTIQAAANYLRQSKKAGRNAQEQEFTKEQETAKLISWINEQDLWFNQHDESRFLASGAEQRVYLDQDSRFVYKLNDTIFYQFWLDYFYSLLIHNYFFPSTSYELIGFFQENNVLFAVVKQYYVEMTAVTEVNAIRNLLSENGFIHKKNNDYFNPIIGIILEDLHEENVLTNTDVLFFIDTVFYLDESFF